MTIKKNKLYSSIWASWDELRRDMDASQYKDYILTFLFLKYVTDIDKVIETLEQPTTKTQQLKQGVMQELLRGSTRLV